MTPAEVAQFADQLYATWYSSLVRYAARVTGSVDLARDLVQEAFLLLAQELLAGKTINHPKAWTLQVVRHQVSKQLAEHKDSGIVFESIDTAPDWGDKTPPVLRVEPSAPLDDLSRYIAVLSTREEEALLLRLEGHRYHEIAAELHVSTGTVRTLLSRALKKMRAVAGSSARTRSGVREL